MQEFIILDSTTHGELARVETEDAGRAITWFLSTRESFERDEESAVVAIEPNGLKMRGEPRLAALELLRSVA